MNARDYVYDVEALTNYFCCTIKRVENGMRWIFEVGPFKNQSAELAAFVRILGAAGCRMVGFNNLSYDYPMLHCLDELVSKQGYATAEQLYWKSQQIIGTQDDNRFANVIWERDRICPQMDLLKVHHFDNKSKRTGLKVLQINMRAHSVQDMPIHHTSTITTAEEAAIVVDYNCHDVDETERFYHFSKTNIEFRDELSLKLGKDFSNHNDTKIGKDYFVDRLEAASPGITKGPGGRGKAQTPRSEIRLADCIFPYIRFQHPEFNRALEYLRATTITNTRKAPELKGLSATVEGCQFDFGLGGLHGSIKRSHIRADDENEILDVDVGGYYPDLAIKNLLYPEHLGITFVDVYRDLVAERKQYPKKTAPNEMLKLANNGVYGESNNEFGVFLDPKYTMTVTVNGQLLLCMLAEWLLAVPGVRVIQANTDGVTALVPRAQRAAFDNVCKTWEAFTCLQLEYANYSDMWIRDVNSYVARTTKGSMKRIGAFIYETQRENPATREVWWCKDHSALVVPKAAEAALLAGRSSAIEEFVWNHPDPFDFMLRQKVDRKSALKLDDGTPLPPTVRYYVSLNGAGLVKTMPELASKPGTGPRDMRVNVGWKASICNIATDFDPANLDRRYYIEEAKKLVESIVA